MHVCTQRYLELLAVVTLLGEGSINESGTCKSCNVHEGYSHVSPFCRKPVCALRLSRAVGCF